MAQPRSGVIVTGIKPNNYLAVSLFSLFCCCWLFGLIALLYSLQVNKHTQIKLLIEYVPGVPFT